ncbi:hypothetical protein QUB56_30605 [Microcoleus sp. AR_TQ3_B6]|uniref:hypothetical protein n=1 Tax=Microcoleus sp. AR_TQ3_B6 TaxID=3055284 RepID=UPI002FCF9014
MPVLGPRAIAPLTSCFRPACDRSHPALFKAGIGTNLYEMLTGKLPFPSNDPLEIVYSHIAVPPLDIGIKSIQKYLLQSQRE